MPTPVVSTPIVPLDASFVLAAGANPLAVPYPNPPATGTYPAQSLGPAGTNPNRTFLMFQAPKAVPVSYSFTNPTPSDPAGVVTAGTFILAADAVSPNWGNVVPKGPVYFNGGAAGNGTLMVLQEC